MAAVLQEKHFSSEPPSFPIVLWLWRWRGRTEGRPGQIRNRPLSPQYCLFLPVAFLFSKKKRTLSKNRFGARVPMGFETFFSTPSSHASSLARPWRVSRGKNRIWNRQEDHMGGGEKSLFGVFGEQIMVSWGWSIPGAWTFAERTRSRDFRARSRYEGFMGNPSMSRETSLCSGLILTGRKPRLLHGRVWSLPKGLHTKHFTLKCKGPHSL